ncbi:MAG: pyrroline-5-carboxylate reductase [Pirellula sp.]
MIELKFGFLGGGQMASAIARGAVVSGIASDENIAFFDTSTNQIQTLREKFPRSCIVDSATELFSICRRIVLAVKPQTLAEIAGGFREVVTEQHLLVSIAAGIPLDKLSLWFGTQRIIRVMPNTPCQSLEGASGIAVAKSVTDNDVEWCESLFGSVGKVVRVSEEQLHGVTGVSGSGPAYVLMMIEALSDGGVMAGLSRQAALELATQTVLGTAKMVQETGIHPAVLREQVTSPAGTTIAALSTLERAGFRSAVIDGVMAAVKRSRELAS